MNTDILIAHPGKHHALYLVAGCIKSGASVNYVTPFYRKGLGEVIAHLPGKIGDRAKGYIHSNIPKNCVVSPAIWQFKKLKSLLANNNNFYQEFDSFVAKNIELGKYKSRVLVTLQDYMPLTVNAAKKAGWKIWSDQILNQSHEMRARVLRHEIALSIVNPWIHNEDKNNYVLANADIVTIPSKYTLDGICDRVSKCAKFRTIPYGASAQQFSGEKISIKNVITVLARANSIRKGGHLLLKALEMCGDDLLATNRNKTIKVRILGEYEPALKQLLNSIKLPFGLSVEHGNIPHSEVAKLYREASIFVMPSLSESMSLACIEAMQASLPLVITKYCGIDNFVSGAMGYEVEDTVESISIYLTQAFINQKSWPYWGAAARAAAETLTWDDYAANISKTANEILL